MRWLRIGDRRGRSDGGGCFDAFAVIRHARRGGRSSRACGGGISVTAMTAAEPACGCATLGGLLVCTRKISGRQRIKGDVDNCYRESLNSAFWRMGCGAGGLVR